MRQFARKLNNVAVWLLLVALLTVGSGVVLLRQGDASAQRPEAVTRCLNDLFWISRDVHFVNEGDAAILLMDRIGWHVTWMAAVDFSENVPRAYDTFGAEGELSGVLFRQPIRWHTMLGFKLCGVEYEGPLQSSIDTWILEVAGLPAREPYVFPPQPRSTKWRTFNLYYHRFHRRFYPNLSICYEARPEGQIRFTPPSKTAHVMAARLPAYPS